MAAMHMKDSGGTWRAVGALHMKDSVGTWREITAGWMKDSTGTWRQFFAAGVVSLLGEATTDTGVGVTGRARIEIRSTGIVYEYQENGTSGQVDSGTDWIIPNAAANSSYEVRATLDSGDTPSGTLATWLDLGTTRTWELSEATSGLSKSCSLTLEIRKDGGAALASATYTLFAERVA